jgi:hypothetical protein
MNYETEYASRIYEPFLYLRDNVKTGIGVTNVRLKEGDDITVFTCAENAVQYFQYYFGGKVVTHPPPQTHHASVINPGVYPMVDITDEFDYQRVYVSQGRKNPRTMYAWFHEIPRPHPTKYTKYIGWLYYQKNV